MAEAHMGASGGTGCPRERYGWVRLHIPFAV